MRFAATASIVFLFTSGSCLFGDTIVSTHCLAGLAGRGENVVDSTGECATHGPSIGWYGAPSYAAASANAGYRLEPPDYHLPEGTYRFYSGVGTLAISGEPGSPFPYGYALASGYAEINLRTTTAGPMRPGLIDLFSFRSSRGDQTSYVQAMIGDLFAGGQYEGNCGGPCTGTYPFVLGQPFDIRAIAFAQSWTEDHYAAESNGSGLALRFRLRELDGTPVYLSLIPDPTPVPEPSTLLLLAPALLLLLLVRVARRNHTRNSRRPMMGPFRLLPCVVLLIGTLCSTPKASADTIYATNAGTNIFLRLIDTDTGATIREITPASGAGLNGRGAVVVGNTFYWSNAHNANVSAYDLVTDADLGVQFSVAGASALSAIAYDGTNFWISDYSGTNRAFYYSPTGTLLRTITLSNVVGFYGGLEHAILNGQECLIANRGDPYGPYDLYDLDGNLITDAFIDPGEPTIGIAFDGTDFYTSAIQRQIKVWDINGAFIRNIDLDFPIPGHLIEDLSFEYREVLPPPPSQIPEPSTLTMILGGLLALLARRQRIAGLARACGRAFPPRLRR